MEGKFTIFVVRNSCNGMVNKLVLPAFLLLTALYSTAQEAYYQYFDGADTSASNSIIIHIDTAASVIWQIGQPQKIIFDSAATLPNVIVTDTVNFYPVNNTSSFQFTIVPWMNWGILAVQWMQKLDMDSGFDGGKVEFSVDAGASWENAFNNPHVYNFYGFLPENHDTLETGEDVFTGSDSTWRDIWLCYDMSWLSFIDSIMVRYTFISDPQDNGKEGWMIDNMLAHLTIIHTIGEKDQDKYINVYPNPATDIIYIETQKLQEFHIIEYIALYNSQGIVVEEWSNIPTKYFIKTYKYSNGVYYLTIRTNIKTETIPIVLRRN